MCGCVDGSWEADTVQENHPLATDLFSRWQFQSNSHPASQWLWPPNISITSSSTGLPQPVTQQRGKVALIPADARFYVLKCPLPFLQPLASSPKHSMHASSESVLDCSHVAAGV